MKRLLWFIITLLLIISYSYSKLFQISEKEPAHLTSGKSIYKWEIKRLILEYMMNKKPTIQQGTSYLKANTIIYDEQNQIGYAYGNLVFYDSQERVKLTSGEGIYYTKMKKIIVKKNPKIRLEKNKTVATSEEMLFFTDEDYIVLNGNVHIQSENISISGDKARYFESLGIFKVIGNAQTVDNETILTADKIDIVSKNNKVESYTATGNVVIENTNDNYIIKAGKTDYYGTLGYSKISEDPVIEFKDKNIQVYSTVMEKYDDEKKANLLGNVIIVTGDRQAFSRWGEYLFDEKIMILTGNPILIQGNSKFNAHKILVNVSEETMSMIGGGSGFVQYTK